MLKFVACNPPILALKDAFLVSFIFALYNYVIGSWRMYYSKFCELGFKNKIRKGK
jgi:hypothetical protein